VLSQRILAQDNVTVVLAGPLPVERSEYDRYKRRALLNLAVAFDNKNAAR
jgi:hypothetical protein